MGITNNILQNVIRSVFYHIPQGGEGKVIRVKVIILNQRIILIKLGSKNITNYAGINNITN